MESIGKNGSIAERLALLKSNGENNWRKKVMKKDISEEIIKKESLVGVSWREKGEESRRKPEETVKLWVGFEWG
jgi:hypothetical protein